MRVRYDHIVVGGGSSGCVAATRLVRDRGARVLLIERGQERQPRLMHMPAGCTKYHARKDRLRVGHHKRRRLMLGRSGGRPAVRAAGPAFTQ